jgi:hypothetical protein
MEPVRRRFHGGMIFHYAGAVLSLAEGGAPASTDYLRETRASSVAHDVIGRKQRRIYVIAASTAASFVLFALLSEIRSEAKYFAIRANPD